MAAKPIERFVKKQIADQGGWSRILERIGSGETVADIARTLRKPDGSAPSRNWFSMVLHADAERSKAVDALRDREAPDALVDAALHDVETAPVDRDGTNHAKVKAEVKLKVAGFMNRQRWGEQRQAAVNVTVQSATLHVDALRHRMVEASRPLAGALGADLGPLIQDAVDAQVKVIGGGEGGVKVGFQQDLEGAPQAPQDGGSQACETERSLTSGDTEPTVRPEAAP